MRVLPLALALLASSSAFAAEDERIFNLPCEPNSIAPSGDRKTLWFSCFDKDDGNQGTSRLYVLNTLSSDVTVLRQSAGWTQVFGAPAGTAAIVTVPDSSSAGKAFLYQGSSEVSSLPTGAGAFLAWSSDAKQLYFYGGTTLEADAWNIVGILRLDGLAVSRTKLSVPTEDVNVCATNGHVFAGIVSFDRSGNAEPYAAAEYDSDLRFIRRNNKVPPGSLSATCRYVASPGSFPHGPAPWRVIDTATGRALKRFEFGADGEHGFEFKSWNPKRDDLLLRLQYGSHGPDTAFELQIFDVARQRVVDRVPDFSGEAAWSRDGESLIFSRGRSLVFRSVSPGPKVIPRQR